MVEVKSHLKAGPILYIYEYLGRPIHFKATSIHFSRHYRIAACSALNSDISYNPIMP